MCDGLGLCGERSVGKTGESTFDGNGRTVNPLNMFYELKNKEWVSQCKTQAP